MEVPNANFLIVAELNPAILRHFQTFLHIGQIRHVLIKDVT
jgi:hypothetical protein